MDFFNHSIKSYFKIIKYHFFSPDISPLRTINDKRFIFIHINKTGGTSITTAVGIPYVRHLIAKEIINLIGIDAWKSAYKFTVIRNPWDKVVSQYKYRVQTNQHQMKDRPISFEDWVTYTYEKTKNLFYYDSPRMFAPHSEWLKDFDDCIDIDKIIKFESLEEDFKTISNQLAIKKKLPHLKKTFKADYRQYYNDKTAQIIADSFKEDIVRFKYQF